MVMGKRPRKIVLTGGPCAGKSTIAVTLSRTFEKQLRMVPESASMLFRGGFPRHKDEKSKRSLQNAIYRVQVEIETVYETHSQEGCLLLDRGTLDGAAYWPAAIDDFFASQKTTREAEFSRYDHVIYLQSPEKSDYELHRLHNPSRTEEWQEAREVDARTLNIWSHHPSFTFVNCRDRFDEKVADVHTLVSKLLEGTAFLS